MRIMMTLAALILVAQPATHAQTRPGGSRPAPPPMMPPAQPTMPPARATMPPAPPTVPPPITYPFAPLMTPPAGGLLPRAGEGPPFRTRSSAFFPYGSTAYAPFAFGYPESVDGGRSRSPLPAATGLLQLSVTPPSAQVFVDSYYVGTVDDINAQRVLQLEAGPHRLEFRAPQYQTLTVDVRVLPYETVTYRGALDAARPSVASAPAAAVGPTVMYMIPKCYLGNLPPRQSRLPAGCDVKQVEVIRPPSPITPRP